MLLSLITGCSVLQARWNPSVCWPLSSFHFPFCCFLLFFFLPLLLLLFSPPFTLTILLRFSKRTLSWSFCDGWSHCSVFLRGSQGPTLPIRRWHTDSVSIIQSSGIWRPKASWWLMGVQELGQYGSSQWAILPSEDIGNIWRNFGFRSMGSHYWHLVGRGQDCCGTFYSAQVNYVTLRVQSA